MNTETPALPESVRVACTTDWSAGPHAVDPLIAAMIEASEAGELVDLDAVCAALPPCPPDIADEAEALLEAGHARAVAAMSIPHAFARRRPPRIIAGLADIAFACALAGDAQEVVAEQMAMALAEYFGWRDGHVLGRRTNAVTSHIGLHFWSGDALRQADSAVPPTSALALGAALAADRAEKLAEYESPTDPLEAGIALAALSRALARYLPIPPAEAVAAARHALTKTGWGEPARLFFDEAWRDAERAGAFGGVAA